MLHALATGPGTWAVEVLLRTSYDDARQQVPPVLGTLEPVAGGVVLRCNVQRLRWLAYFLVGLERELVVRHPPELCDALRELASYAHSLAEARDTEPEHDSRTNAQAGA